MKKAPAVILLIFLVFSLFACHKKGGPYNSPPPSEPAASSSANTSPAAGGSPQTSGPAGQAGFFDPDFDYSKNEKYKVVYMMASTGVLYASFSNAFKNWAGRTNCEYSDYAAGGDNDTFINTLETYATQDIDGFILDPDSSANQRVIELAHEYRINWMGGMSVFRDENELLLHPTVGFDNTAFGIEMANWLIDYAKTAWKLTDFNKVGFMFLDYSISDQIHERAAGAQAAWDEKYPDLKNSFIVPDGVSGALNTDTAFNLAVSAMSANPQYEYWLVAGCIDDYAEGAARAAEELGRQDKTAVTSIGGTGLVAQWDAGGDSCWKSAVFTSQLMYAEPVFMAVYAQMSGLGTPETLWPEWVDHSRGETYASLFIPSFILTFDDYQEVVEWVDQYTGADFSPYEYKGTAFDARAVPPASYAG